MSTKVLDHGYVKHIEQWGSDERIIEAARMSTDKGFLGWGKSKCQHCDGTGRREEHSPTAAAGYEYRTVTCAQCDGQPHKPGDEKLLAYLYTHKHMTPFEMAGMTIEVQAPIFVFREWHRHRTQSYNEMSARYTPLPDLNYMPSIERLMMDGGSNKQAQGTGTKLDETMARTFQSILLAANTNAENGYQAGLQMGVPKELARLMLPVARYSRMRASANLRNWLAFLTLRMDPAAQWEIRQYANVVGKEIELCFPRTWALFNQGR